MSGKTVRQLAEAVKIPLEKLLEQLKEAGLSASTPDDVISEDEKMLLLAYMHKRHGTRENNTSRRVALERRKVTEIGSASVPGCSTKTISVEVRKKKNYIEREAKKFEKSEKILNCLSIKNFKCINQDFHLKLLTLLTGLNSTGKSSVIQSLLLLSKHYSQRNQALISAYVEHFSDFSEIRNKYTNAKSLFIEARNNQQTFSLSMDYDNTERHNQNATGLNFEEDFYYMSANRVGQESLASFSKEQKTGRHGEYIFGYFETNKDKPLFSELIKFKASSTLKYQVNGWLNYILDFPVTLQTDKITATNIKVSFEIDNISDISPFNVGAGNSYLAKILITCLLGNKGDIIIIENPEIHLHPKAQSRLGEFFAWLAQAGIQLIIETHSEHLINKVKYQVYKKTLTDDNVIIYYKASITEKFETIKINHKGNFVNENNEKISFPTGFFDSTLTELLEIG